MDYNVLLAKSLKLGKIKLFSAFKLLLSTNETKPIDYDCIASAK